MTEPTSSDTCAEPAPDLEALTRLFRTLSDPVRLRILLLLTEGERNVTSLCTTIGLAQPTVSHHLGLLRMASLAQTRRSGKSIFYSTSPRIRADTGQSIRFQAGEASAAEIRLRGPATPASHERAGPAELVADPV
jgi:DNA-binding transcriptional ArsR family regulator